MEPCKMAYMNFRRLVELSKDFAVGATVLVLSLAIVATIGYVMIRMYNAWGCVGFVLPIGIVLVTWIGREMRDYYHRR